MGLQSIAKEAPACAGASSFVCIAAGRAVNETSHREARSGAHANQQAGSTQWGSLSGSSRCGEPTGMSRNVTQNSRSVAPTLRTR